MARIDKISEEDYKKVTETSEAARELLKDERFEFFRARLNDSLNYIEKCILENTICDVRETHSISEKILKTFIRSKKEQVDELSGQYKLIKKIFADLEYDANLKTSLDKEIENRKVVVDDRKI